jgi:3-hydroxy-9,10-secoandrosta-1,3,5(10)-triene-9,17-dione monooxygenase reductase component
MTDPHEIPEIEIDPQHFRRTMGHYPTGVTVIAALEEGHPIGLAIGSFFSASLSPPLVGFCVGHTSTTWPRIQKIGRFGITVLAEDQHETSGRFGSKVDNKFEGQTWVPAPVTGSPLIESGIEHIDCVLHSAFEGADHVIVLGRVLYLDVPRDDVGPLLFFRGGYGKHAQI